MGGNARASRRSTGPRGRCADPRRRSPATRRRPSRATHTPTRNTPPPRRNNAQASRSRGSRCNRDGTLLRRRGAPSDTGGSCRNDARARGVALRRVGHPRGHRWVGQSSPARHWRRAEGVCDRRQGRRAERHRRRGCSAWGWTRNARARARRRARERWGATRREGNARCAAVARELTPRRSLAVGGGRLAGWLLYDQTPPCGGGSVADQTSRSLSRAAKVASNPA